MQHPLDALAAAMNDQGTGVTWDTERPWDRDAVDLRATAKCYSLFRMDGMLEHRMVDWPDDKQREFIAMVATDMSKTLASELRRVANLLDPT